MIDNRPIDVIGMTLAEVDPNLFEETRENLESGSLSYAADYVTEAQRAVILVNLIKASIRKTCQCGQADCRTYYFERPRKNDVPDLTIRFHVRGELLLDVSAEMDVIGVERLYDLDDDGAARTVYGFMPDGSGYLVELGPFSPDDT